MRAWRAKLLRFAAAGMVTAALVFGLAPAPDAEAFFFKRGKATVNLVHGIEGDAGFPVDIYIVNNFRRQTLEDVTFGTAAALEVRAGWVYVAILPAGSIGDGDFDKPILRKFFRIRNNRVKTVAAYTTADADGNAGAPTLGVFSAPRAPRNGSANVTAYHLAIAPEVGVYANGAVAITEGFVNGQTASANVPADTYNVTITAPGDPGTVLFPVGNVALAPNASTQAFAIGTFPSTFTVVALVND